MGVKIDVGKDYVPPNAETIRYMRAKFAPGEDVATCGATENMTYKTKEIETKHGPHTVKRTVLDAPEDYVPKMGDLLASPGTRWKEFAAEMDHIHGLGMTGYCLLAQAPAPPKRRIVQGVGVEYEGDDLVLIPPNTPFILVSHDGNTSKVKSRPAEFSGAAIHGFRLPVAGLKVRVIGTEEWHDFKAGGA
jgi:hypothetical protein